jgi:hypothetical protein
MEIRDVTMKRRVKEMSSSINRNTHTYIDVHGAQGEQLAVVDEAVAEVVVDKETEGRELAARLDEVHAFLL